MVHFFQCCSAHKPLMIPFFFFSILLLTSSMEMTLSDARRLPLRRRLLEIDTTKEERQELAAAEIMSETMGTRRRSLIGSRPPRCERVCRSCGHCEAVQVPIVPQEHRNRKQRAHRKEEQAEALSAALFSYRVDGITNYKPLSWKCRCGGAILDP